MAGLLNLVPRVPPPIRHGAGVDEGDPTARAAVHGHHVPDHDPLQSQRRGSGRRLRHRRPRADDVGRGCCDAASAALAAGAFGFGPDRARLRLHDGREHLRAAGRHQDRVVVHRHHHRDVADLARASLDRASHPGRGSPIPRRRTSFATWAAARCGSSPTAPILAIRKSTRASCAKRGSRITSRSTSPFCFSKFVPATYPTSTGRLKVMGADVAGHHVLRCVSPAIPNAIAGLLLFIRDRTGQIPHAYFGWTEGNPLAYLLKFLAFGEGDTAPGHSRGASPVGAQSAAPAPHSRRLALDQSTSDTAASSTPRPLTAVTSKRRPLVPNGITDPRRTSEERQRSRPLTLSTSS